MRLWPAEDIFARAVRMSGARSDGPVPSRTGRRQRWATDRCPLRLSLRGRVCPGTRRSPGGRRPPSKAPHPRSASLRRALSHLRVALVLRKEIPHRRSNPAAPPKELRARVGGRVRRAGRVLQWKRLLLPNPRRLRNHPPPPVSFLRRAFGMSRCLWMRRWILVRLDWWVLLTGRSPVRSRLGASFR